MSRTLLRGGKLVTADETREAELLIENGLIAAIGEHLPENDAEIIDVSGKLVMPGGVDPHVHLDLPMFGTVSSDDHYSGTKAAAFGGTTTLIDFVSQDFDDFSECVTALSLFAILGFVGFAIDTGMVLLHRVWLGQAVDAASLAAGFELPNVKAACVRAVDYLRQCSWRHQSGYC